MSKLSFLLFLMLSGVTALGYAAQSFMRKAESSVSETVGPQGPAKTVVNTVFAVDSLYDPKRKVPTDVLISQRIESIFHSGKEVADSNLEAVAWITRQNKYDTKLWIIKDRADAGGRWGDFYRTTMHGCCGAETVYRAFNYSTGKYAFSFTAEPVFADIPNTPIKRNISYISANAASDYEHGKQSPRGVGMLTISADDSFIDQVIVETDDRELAWSPKLSLIDAKEPKGTSRLSLWHSNGISKAEAVKAFSVKLFFYDGMEIIVPVNGDRFDIEKSVLPKGASIRRISLMQLKRSQS